MKKQIKKFCERNDMSIVELVGLVICAGYIAAQLIRWAVVSWF